MVHFHEKITKQFPSMRVLFFKNTNLDAHLPGAKTKINDSLPALQVMIIIVLSPVRLSTFFISSVRSTLTDIQTRQELSSWAWDHNRPGQSLRDFCVCAQCGSKIRVLSLDVSCPPTFKSSGFFRGPPAWRVWIVKRWECHDCSFPCDFSKLAKNNLNDAVQQLNLKFGLPFHEITGTEETTGGLSGGEITLWCWQ